VQQLISDSDPPLAVEPGLSTHERDRALPQPRELPRVIKLVDHFVATGEHSGGLEAFADGLSRAGNAVDFGEQLGRTQECL
jgi:hypothetical protein